MRQHSAWSKGLNNISRLSVLGVLHMGTQGMVTKSRTCRFQAHYESFGSNLGQLIDGVPTPTMAAAEFCMVKETHYQSKTAGSQCRKHNVQMTT